MSNILGDPLPGPSAESSRESEEDIVAAMSENCALEEASPMLADCSDVPADDTTCAICLNQIAASETAQPACCEHIYCTCCLLHWAVYKEKPWCPQCKLPFSSILTFRTLDGQLHDYPCKESIGLLKRAHWFQEHLKKKEQAIVEAMLPESIRNRVPEGSVIDDTDYLDYARYYEEYDDDEEVADYYFSSAAGSARVVIGNRRHGPNGYMSSGRMQARPAAPVSQPKGKQQPQSGDAAMPKNKSTPSKGPVSSTPKTGVPGRKKTCVGADYDDDLGSSGKQSAGRRARRNQRKAAADARAWG